jgi:hypothetical protein
MVKCNNANNRVHVRSADWQASATRRANHQAGKLAREIVKIFGNLQRPIEGAFKLSSFLRITNKVRLGISRVGVAQYGIVPLGY